MKKLDRFSLVLCVLYVLDHLLKLIAVEHFFRRGPVPRPRVWPTVTLLQPITRGASDLRAALTARVHLEYPASIQHLLVCDHADTDSLAICRDILRHYPALEAQIVEVAGVDTRPALKTVKLQAGLPLATGEIICCVDDDITLRPTTLLQLVPEVLPAHAGAAFGLACYTSWQNLPSSLMSIFVNANALLSYIPLTYLADPFTITGHCFALRRSTLDAVGGFAGMEHRVDDDHDLARRLRANGLQSVQTTLVYDVVNTLPSLSAYQAQIKRWFIFPRQALIPFLTPWERIVSAAGSIAMLIPVLQALMVIFTRRRIALLGASTSLILFASTYSLCEARYLHRKTPPMRWVLLPFVALLTPLQICGALLSNKQIEWRGQQLRIARGGAFEVVQ